MFGIWFANVESSWALIILGACLAMSAQWLSFGLHNYQAELYPTRIRARGVGFVYSWSRLSGILTPFFIAFFLRDFGPTGVFVFVAVCMAVVILSVAAARAAHQDAGSGGDCALATAACVGRLSGRLSEAVGRWPGDIHSRAGALS